MAYPGPSAQPSQSFAQAAFASLGSSSGSSSGASSERAFEVFEWYPSYQNCQRYFLDQAQHQEPVKAVAAFLNICLPCQRHPDPIMTYSSSTRSTQPGMGWASARWPGSGGPPAEPPSTNWVSLVPYLRRLIVTASDLPIILHGFFGDDWVKGVGLLHEQERRNYLFAAKSEGWASVKKGYDISPEETVPFLRPLREPLDAEIQAAEKTWGEWLAMEDWMVGPRAPAHMQDSNSSGRGHPSR